MNKHIYRIYQERGHRNIANSVPTFAAATAVLLFVNVSVKVYVKSSPCA